MAPHHVDHNAQSAASPFVILAASDAGSSMVTVTISSPTGDKFKGFLVSARLPSDVGNSLAKNVGQFFPGDDGFSQTLTCNSTAVSPQVHLLTSLSALTPAASATHSSGCHHSQEQ